MKNLIDLLTRYESGQLNEEETIVFFQHLIDVGLCWELQGHYGRTAQRMIEEELCYFSSDLQGCRELNPVSSTNDGSVTQLEE
jgi:hypothetical protein